MTLNTNYILTDAKRGLKRFVKKSEDLAKFNNPQPGQELAYEVCGGSTEEQLLRDAALACALYIKQGKEIEAGTAFAFAWQRLNLDGKAELQKARS